MGFWEKAVEPGDSGNTNGKRSEGDTKKGITIHNV